MSGGACSQCGSAAVDAEVCAACSEWPPLSQRTERLGPLGLGALGVVLGFLIVPSVLAIRRAWRDLRELARRERAGVWREEHERIRDRAVLGILLAALVPVLGIAQAASSASELAGEGPTDVRSMDDELSEVLAFFAENEQVHHGRARRQLEALAPGLSDAELDRVLARAEDDAEGWAMLHALMVDEARHERVLPRLADAFPRMPMDEQEMLLQRLARSHAPSAMTTLAALASGPLNPRLKPPIEGGVWLEHTLSRPLYARFPLAPLTARGDAAAVLRALLSNPEHRYFRSAFDLAAEWCRAGVAAEALREMEPVYVDAVATEVCQPLWDEDPSGDADRPSGRACEGNALVALGCMSGSAANAILDDGLRFGDTPELVIEARLLRGDEVADATIAELARDVRGRRFLYLALARLGAEHRFPAELRSPYALAQAEMWEECAREPRLLAQRDARIDGRDAHFVVLDCEVVPEEGEPHRAQRVIGPVVTTGLPPCETTSTRRVPTDNPVLMHALLGEAIDTCAREAAR